MTINEFKAWLDGYVQAKDGQLNVLDVWSIKAKLDEIIAPLEPITPHNPVYPRTTPWTPWQPIGTPGNPWSPGFAPFTTSGTDTNGEIK